MSRYFSGVCIDGYKLHLTILWTFISTKIQQMFAIPSVIKCICTDQNNLQIFHFTLHFLFNLGTRMKLGSFLYPEGARGTVFAYI